MPSGSALLFAAHHRFADGRAVFDPLEDHRIAAALQRFAELVPQYPDNDVMRVGLANACALAFEISRDDRGPDVDALRAAELQAREACQLNPANAEAWAALGFVLDRAGEREAAVTALGRAVALEPGNWRHQLRLASASWGEARLAAARHTLALRPGCGAARRMAATVFVARGDLGQAEREIDGGLAGVKAGHRQSLVALHWMKGLLLLRRDAEGDALEQFQCEQAMEVGGYAQARGFSANACYTIGVCHLRRGDMKSAGRAFEQALTRAPRHAMAQAASAVLAATSGKILASFEGVEPQGRAGGSHRAVDAAVAWAALRAAAGDVDGAAELVQTALAGAPPDDGGWYLPIEPMLGVHRHPDAWAPVLAALRARAS